MELRDLEDFAILVEELNFRRAALRLGIQQPTLTRRIKRIERELGVYLLERHARRIRLTEAGKILAECSHRLLMDGKRLRNAIIDASVGNRGQLAIGFFTALASEIFTQVFGDYARSSEIRLSLSEETGSHQLRNLRNGSLDLALVIGPVPDEDLNAEPLWVERLILIAPLAHHLMDIPSISWLDLAEECFVVRTSTNDRSVANFIEDRAAHFGGFHPFMKEFAVARENLVALVRAGYGIALLSEASLHSLNTDGVHCRPMTGPGSTIEITAAWLPENANPLLRHFLERINQAVASHEPSPENPDPPA